ncbi:hypothetical protein [Pseudoalteromonas sp. Angola-4]|uniref:hypothetical protein n=1 Tax=Pseudoalteromonas sp. Angola-4 TaxID=3025335 RepID=UPI002359AD39|nr:hypothetical protein [Pseudoalteromonas sp. Angola-4]
MTKMKWIEFIANAIAEIFSMFGFIFIAFGWLYYNGLINKTYLILPTIQSYTLTVAACYIGHLTFKTIALYCNCNKKH